MPRRFLNGLISAGGQVAGTYAARPATGVEGQRYIASLSGGGYADFLWTGGAWVLVSQTVPRIVLSPLPAADLFDGREVEFVLNTGGVGDYPVWRFRYVAAHGDAYKWQFVGGTPLRSQHGDQTVGGATNTAYADMPNLPPLTLPIAGIYDITISGLPISSIAGTWIALMSYRFSGGTVGTAFDGYGTHSMVGGGHGTSTMKRHRHTLAANTVVTPQHRQTVTTQTDYYRTWLEAVPVRVG